MTYQARRPIGNFQAGGTAQREVGTADGALMTLQQVSQSALAAGTLTGRGATRLVVASNASAEMLAAADSAYLCDGTADEVQINAALNSLSGYGGTVLLSEGQFNLAGPIVFGGVRRTLRGIGMQATYLRVIDSGGAAINTLMIQLSHNYNTLSDLTIDGNRANNAGATSMQLINLGAVLNPLVQRVYCLNSAQYGLIASSSASDTVVRDCLFYNSFGIQIACRGSVNNPMLVSGCVTKGGSGIGFYCDDGPSMLSNCHALQNTSYGFYVTAANSPVVSLDACIAQGNGDAGFFTAGPRTKFVACQSLANINAGFQTDGVQTQFVGCTAIGITGNGYGFFSSTNGIDSEYNGCSTADEGYGFVHSSTGRGIYAGCRAWGHGGYGFYANQGEAIIRGCMVYGLSNAGWGMRLDGGANHSVHGCRVTNIGGHGIYTNCPDVQITNNYVSDCSLVTDNTYYHIVTDGARTFISGNVLRNPASGNRAAYGIVVTAVSANVFLGYNDVRGAGVTKEILDLTTTTRRIAKLQLDYLPAATIFGANVPANVWTDVCPNQTFQVQSNRSMILISCRGSLHTGNTGSVGAVVTTRLAIDSATSPLYRNLGGQGSESTAQYENSLAGGAPVILTNLPIGAHTVKLQTRFSVAGQGWLRPDGAPGYESLNIQVVEFAR